MPAVSIRLKQFFSTFFLTAWSAVTLFCRTLIYPNRSKIQQKSYNWHYLKASRLITTWLEGYLKTKSSQKWPKILFSIHFSRNLESKSLMKIVNIDLCTNFSSFLCPQCLNKSFCKWTIYTICCKGSCCQDQQLKIPFIRHLRNWKLNF